jgi:septum site-determining protein MinC
MVQLKGIREGLLVVMGEGDWLELSQSLFELIDKQRDFLRGGKLYIDVGNQVLHAAELGRLRDTISERGISLWGILSSSPTTEQTAQTLGLSTRLSRQSEKTAFRGTATVSTKVQDGEAAVLVQRTLRSGYSLQFEGHVVVIGDVNPGAEIVAGGSVVVWGNLRGMVHAGTSGNADATVCALDLDPTQLRIGDYIWNAPKRVGKPFPGLARLLNGEIVTEFWAPAKVKSGGIWPLR